MANKKMKNTIDVAVLSDIHSNHIALQACIAYLKKRKIEHFIVPFDRMKVVQELNESGLIEESKLFGRMIRGLLVTKIQKLKF